MNKLQQPIRRALQLKHQLSSNLISRKISTMPRKITTAAALIIGDEVLNSKIKDTNSHYFAKFCFEKNIELKNISVVPDEEDEIVETLQRLCSKYDFIVTTGGIGPTHDDITYEAIAKAFGVGVVLDEEVANRMKALGRKPVNEGEAQAARLRMATIPKSDPSKNVIVEKLFTNQYSWVPTVSVNSQVYIFPGIPQLFQSMIQELYPLIKDRLITDAPVRFFVSTEMSESNLAPYLTKKQAEVKLKGIKLGSYPHFDHGTNTVSIIGKSSDTAFLRELVKDVELNVEGTEISAEEEAKLT